MPENTKGVVITKISSDSPLLFVSVNDIIVELQKKKVISSKQFSNLVKEIARHGGDVSKLVPRDVIKELKKIIL